MTRVSQVSEVEERVVDTPLSSSSQTMLSGVDLELAKPVATNVALPNKKTKV